MTAPEPSGCAITGDAAACTAAALLVDPSPEIVAAWRALRRADCRPWWAPWRRWVAVQHLAEALGTVEYLASVRRRFATPGGEG
jgi:hypothetical protein